MVEDNPDLPEAWKVQGETGGEKLGIGELSMKKHFPFRLIACWDWEEGAEFENVQKIFL